MIGKLTTNPLEQLRLMSAGDAGTAAAGGAEPDPDELMAQFQASLSDEDRAAMEALNAAVDNDNAQFTQAEAPEEPTEVKYPISTELASALPDGVSDTVTYALSRMDKGTQGQLITAFGGNGRELATAIEDLDRGVDHDAPTARDIMRRKEQADRHGVTLAQLSAIGALKEQSGLPFSDALFLSRHVNELKLDEHGNAAGSEVTGRVNAVRTTASGRQITNSRASDAPTTAMFDLSEIVGNGPHNFKAMAAKARHLVEDGRDSFSIRELRSVAEEAQA